jgi:hypothetical protein
VQISLLQSAGTSLSASPTAPANLRVIIKK